jgi:hypothetical protein
MRVAGSAGFVRGVDQPAVRGVIGERRGIELSATRPDLQETAMGAVHMLKLDVTRVVLGAGERLFAEVGELKLEQLRGVGALR